MKRILLALLIVLVAAPQMFAVENSNTYFPLVSSPTFTGRVQYILAQEAPVIEVEAQSGSYTAACHTLRAGLAVRVAQNPASYAPVFAVFLTTNINVTTAGALTGTSAAGTLDTPATDAALLAAVASLWPNVAGCVTNP